MEFRDAVAARRSAYSLDDGIGAVGASEGSVIDALRKVIPLVPSAFNMRSVRTVVLFGDDHRRLWREVGGILRARMEGRDFSATEAKMASFSSAAGTILFYEVDTKTEELMEEHPSYRDLFPQWAEHGNAMMQFAFWTAIADMGLGANIQHYNPIVDARVAEEFGIPDGYRLIAQMVFGRVVTPAGPKDKLTGEDLVAVARVNNNKPKDM